MRRLMALALLALVAGCGSPACPELELGPLPCVPGAPCDPEAPWREEWPGALVAFEPLRGCYGDGE